MHTMDPREFYAYKRASNNWVHINNEIDETGYVPPLETRFLSQQPDKIRLPTRRVPAVKIKGPTKLTNGDHAKSNSDPFQVSSEMLSLIKLNLESAYPPKQPDDIRLPTHCFKVANCTQCTGIRNMFNRNGIESNCVPSQVSSRKSSLITLDH